MQEQGAQHRSRRRGAHDRHAERLRDGVGQTKGRSKSHHANQELLRSLRSSHEGWMDDVALQITKRRRYKLLGRYRRDAFQKLCRVDREARAGAEAVGRGQDWNRRKLDARALNPRIEL